MRLNHFLAILKARNKEFTRDRASLSWNLLFPFLLVLGLSLAFGDEKRDRYKVGVFPGLATAQSEFLQLDYVQFIEVEDLDEARDKVARHKIDLLLDFQAADYYVNESSANGYVLEKILIASNDVQFSRQTLDGEGINYVDWALPGILGMNLMFSCLFGVGYVIVRYRKNGVLKRLKATPLSAFTFLSAQVASRLVLSLAITTIIFVGTRLLLGTVMNGSYVLLFLVFALGAICLISLSLLMATRTSSEELAGGLLNLMVWPMMVLSGIWFSLEGAPAFLQNVAKLFPLTHVTNAARAVMVDGAGLMQILPSLSVLAVSSFVLLALAAALFKWE